MINRLRIGAVVLTGAALLATSAGIAHAQATKASLKCASSELKAVGKAAKGKWGCYSKAAQNGAAVDPECLSKAEGKLTDAFGKAEAKGGCAQDDNSYDLNVDTIGDGMVASIQNQLEKGATAGGSVTYRGFNGPIISAANKGFVPLLIPAQTASKCTGAKAKAMGKYMSSLFSCESKSASKNLVTNTDCGNPANAKECVCKALSKVSADWDKAEGAGDCLTMNDKANFSDNGFRAWTKILPSILRFDGCGNGVVTGSESCDDGNTEEFDSCPSDCKIAACTPTATQAPVVVHVSDGNAAAYIIELDYPEGKVQLPGFGFDVISNGSVENLANATNFDGIDFEHALRLSIGDTIGLGTDIARLNFVTCNGAPALSAGDFTCNLRQAVDASQAALPNATCSVTVGP